MYCHSVLLPKEEASQQEAHDMLNLDKHGPCFMPMLQGQSVIDTDHCQVYIVCSAGETLHFRKTQKKEKKKIDQALQP